MSDPFASRFDLGLDGVAGELERIGDLADSVSRTLTRTFAGAISEGRGFRAILAEIGRAFADIALRAAIRPLGDLVGGLVESVFQATNPVLQGITPFAKGGVVAAPTYFPLGDGLGLMGEAGREAILPLARGADGRLGVAGGGSGVSVTLNISTPDANSFAASEAELGAMLLRATRRGLRAS
jgi:phage-related minor tail protein